MPMPRAELAYVAPSYEQTTSQAQRAPSPRACLEEFHARRDQYAASPTRLEVTRTGSTPHTVRA
jgi:hypothetical protein